MKPELPEKRQARGRRAAGRVELWTPWGVVRLPRARDAAKAPKKPQPGAWPPSAAAPEGDRKPRA